MKCLVLAGGSGDCLWPLSRKYYPKQFMNIKENRSMLQETIVRNMPYCDEFIIITNASYENIVDGQMKAFQSLKYRVVLEEEAKGPALALLLGCTLCNQSELAFAVSAVHLIDGKNYQESIVKAKELAKAGKIVTFGVTPQSDTNMYGYIKNDNGDVAKFVARPTIEEARGFFGQENWLWNSGITVFSVGHLFNEVRRYAPELLEACMNARKKTNVSRRNVTFKKELFTAVEPTSLEKAVFEKSDNIKVIPIDCQWQDVATVNDLERLKQESDTEGVIENNCDNVSVINHSDRQLVVANDLKDVVIVNTNDATYVSSMQAAGDIKDIIHEHNDEYRRFFEQNTISYREWGIHEMLISSETYRVRKVTVFPGMSMSLHQHEFRSEQWSIVEGTATITLGAETKDYKRNDSIYVPVGMKHKVANYGDTNVVIIEVGLGESLEETDMVRIYDDKNTNTVKNLEPMVKLEPAFKDNLWGGTKLRTVFGKKCDYDIIAESWELSAHQDGPSRVASGKMNGRLFTEYLRKIGKEALGWKCQAMDRFPVLIKFIDAMQALSVQIHPDDDYALEYEGEYGKNEMWYVVDCEPGASLFVGLKAAMTKEQIREKIADNTIIEALNEIKVKPGDVIFVEAGTIHAIGAGILICEIQQNSNSTYRLYDYDRRDKFGNPRQLHLDKALDVVNPVKFVRDENWGKLVYSDEHYKENMLVQCKYFECLCYDVTDEVKVSVNETSFVSIVFLSGNGSIVCDEEVLDYRIGDSFFIQAGKHTVTVKGSCKFIMTHI